MKEGPGKVSCAMIRSLDFYPQELKQKAGKTNCACLSPHCSRFEIQMCFSFFFPVNVQLLQHHLLKGLYFLHWNTFEHLSKMVFLWLCILFYWSVSILSMKLQCLHNLVFSYALVNYSLTDFLLTGVWVTERKVLELQTKTVGLFILRSLRYLLYLSQISQLDMIEAA